MKLITMTCPHCGAILKIDSENKSAVCEYCGSTLLIEKNEADSMLDNAEEAGYKFEKGRQRAQSEALINNNSQQAPPTKKRRTWLWVLGWIFIFPVPLTILMLRKKDMKPALKYGIIAAAWVLYIILIIIGNTGDSEKSQTDTSSSKVIESTTAATTMSAEKETQTVYLLTAGLYEAGVDIPAGTFTVKAISGIGNIISSDFTGIGNSGVNALVYKDEDGKVASSLKEKYKIRSGVIWHLSGTVELELTYSDITKEPSGRVYETTPKYTLTEGFYEVGRDLEPGTYNIKALSGNGNIVALAEVNGFSTSINDIVGAQDGPFSLMDIKNVHLSKGENLTVTLTLEVELYKAID